MKGGPAFAMHAEPNNRDIGHGAVAPVIASSNAIRPHGTDFPQIASAPWRMNSTDARTARRACMWEVVMYAGKVLVVFYSRTGTTRRAASALAEMLDADVEEIAVARDRAGPFGYLRSLVEAINQKPAEIVATQRDPAAYDLVVIGSPVWAGCVSSPVRAYLVANQRRLPRLAFFCSFAQRGADSALTQMRTLARKSPLAECRVTPRETLHGDASPILAAFAEQAARRLAEAVGTTAAR
ncbi:flavodoxin family protein [Burkholderia territorii]|nr:NAD(P)H-dependent oxidoreductase [Burkholderia territorii]